jgi:hypothetical protein
MKSRIATEIARAICVGIIGSVFVAAIVALRGAMGR